MFQRLMERVPVGLQWESRLVCIDDIIIFSKTIEDHQTQLGIIYQTQISRIKAQTDEMQLV